MFLFFLNGDLHNENCKLLLHESVRGLVFWEKSELRPPVGPLVAAAPPVEGGGFKRLKRLVFVCFVFVFAGSRSS